MAYDQATGTVIFLSSKTGQTWSWDGTNWAPLSPVDNPPTRGDGAMAYDYATQQIVLFGGVSGNGYLDDTWTWNGENWTEQTPATSPSARGYTEEEMAYDSNLGELVLFGGHTSSGVLNDTWVWDGSTWSELPPAASPPARHAASMAFDPSSGQLLLFGGTGDAFFNDTWTLTPTSPSTAPLNRYVDQSDSSVHWAAANAAEVPSVFTEEGTIGDLLPYPGPGLLALYSCKDGGDGNYLSIDQTGSCEAGTQPGLATSNLGIEGYVYASQQSGAVELYRCFRPSPFDHLETTVPPVTINGVQRCGEDPTDYAYEGILGWMAATTAAPPAATPEAPSVLLLALAAGTLLGGGLWLSARKRRRPVHSGT
jgi:hypothetical protein